MGVERRGDSWIGGAEGRNPAAPGPISRLEARPEVESPVLRLAPGGALTIRTSHRRRGQVSSLPLGRADDACSVVERAEGVAEAR